ncbi:hypothetical protein ACLOJK_003332 [Asimina triloba]
MQSIPKLQSMSAANSLSVRSNLEQLMCLKSDNFDVANSWMSLTELKNLRKLRLLNVEISEEEQVGEEEWTTLQMPESLQIRESRLYAAEHARGKRATKDIHKQNSVIRHQKMPNFASCINCFVAPVQAINVLI